MPPTSRRFTIPTLVLTLLFAISSQASWAQGDTHEGEPDHLDHPMQIVGIVPTRLMPTVLVVPAGSAFGWLNYSSLEAAIEFEEDITPKLSCSSPGSFRSNNGSPASPRVAGGAFVTLCNLAPGEYDYRVELEGRRKLLLGKLVIEGKG